MTTPDPVRTARARLAVATRDGRTADAAKARLEMKAAKLERAICEAIDSAPPHH